jgi:hypothetical protein
MNRAISYAALLMALLALGCGGSSTGSSTPAAASVPSLSTPTIEAVVFQAGGTPNTFPPVVEDTSNIQVGELVDFQAVAYDSTGGRHVLAATNWRWSDTTNQYGSLDPYSGLFSVGQSPMASRGTVNVTVNGATIAAFYLVNPNQARIIGQVIGSDTNKGLRGIGITFYDSGLNVTAYVVSSYDGTFRASSKTTAVSFSVDPDTVPASYWQSFSYGLNPAYVTDPTQPRLLTFDAGSDTCNAGFQTLYTRTGSQIGTSPIVGDNFLFSPAQPSTVLTPVTPAVAGDPGLIILNARSTYPSRPQSNGCTG